MTGGNKSGSFEHENPFYDDFESLLVNCTATNTLHENDQLDPDIYLNLNKNTLLNLDNNFDESTFLDLDISLFQDENQPDNSCTFPNQNESPPDDPCTYPEQDESQLDDPCTYPNQDENQQQEPYTFQNQNENLNQDLDADGYIIQHQNANLDTIGNILSNQDDLEPANLNPNKFLAINRSGSIETENESSTSNESADNVEIPIEHINIFAGEDLLLQAQALLEEPHSLTVDTGMEKNKGKAAQACRKRKHKLTDDEIFLADLEKKNKKLKLREATLSRKVRTLKTNYIEAIKNKRVIFSPPPKGKIWSYESYILLRS